MAVLMPQKILFIGAGASYGARDAMSLRPPLGPDLCDWLRLNIPKLRAETALVDLWGTIEEAETILKNHSAVSNFEDLLSKLNASERHSLHRLLQIAFSDLTERHGRCDLDIGFRNTNDGYDELIKKLKIEAGLWAIVSLNYDLLIEEALNSITRDFPMRLVMTKVEKKVFPCTSRTDQSTSSRMGITRSIIKSLVLMTTAVSQRSIAGVRMGHLGQITQSCSLEWRKLKMYWPVQADTI